MAKLRGILQKSKADDPLGNYFIYNLAFFKLFSAYSYIYSLVNPGGYHSTPLFLSSNLFLKIFIDYKPLPNPIAKDLSVLQSS